MPLGARGPLLQVSNRAAGALVTSSPDFDLEAFSHNAVHDSWVMVEIGTAGPNLGFRHWVSGRVEKNVGERQRNIRGKER